MSPDPDQPAATGRVFVRFRQDLRALDQAAALRAAGYEIERVPAWAPHTAWVRSPAGTGAALAGIEALRALPGVEAVEPELLRERAHR